MFKRFEKVVQGGKNGVKMGKNGEKWLSQSPQIYTTNANANTGCSYHCRKMLTFQHLKAGAIICKPCSMKIVLNAASKKISTHFSLRNLLRLARTETFVCCDFSSSQRTILPTNSVGCHTIVTRHAKIGLIGTPRYK